MKTVKIWVPCIDRSTNLFPVHYNIFVPNFAADLFLPEVTHRFCRDCAEVLRWLCGGPVRGSEQTLRRLCTGSADILKGRLFGTFLHLFSDWVIVFGPFWSFFTPWFCCFQHCHRHDDRFGRRHCHRCCLFCLPTANYRTGNS